MKASRVISPVVVALALTAAAAAGQGPSAQAPKVDTSGVAAACVRPGQEQRPMMDMTPSERLALVACANRYAAQQINTQTPMRVDEITTLERVETSGATVIYHQRVEVDGANVTSAMMQQLDQSVRGHVCASEQMRNTISYGGAYRYMWTDRSGAFLHRLDITGC